MASEVVTRRLSAVLAADMVGYSRLMQLDEVGTLARQKQCFEELIQPKIREYEGRIVKTTGDGLLAEFPSAVGAVLCAVAVQRNMIAREASIAEDRRITYRIGINLGDVIHDGEDIFGDGVNVAARLEALAEPGGIRISEPVFKTVKGKLDLGFAGLGPQRVKNMAEPIDAYQVLLNPSDAGKVVDAPTPRRRARLGSSIAALLLAFVVVSGYNIFNRPNSAVAEKDIRLLILPFDAADNRSELFADAVSENLWLTMSQVRGIEIAPRSAVLELKGVTPDFDRISQFDGVTHVLNGTVSASNEDIQITSQIRLVNSSMDTVVWENEVETPAKDLFIELGRQKLDVLSSLNVELNAIERQILQKQYTNIYEAFLKYAEGWSKRTAGHWNDLAAALHLFNLAIELDPDFVEAKEELAWVNFNAWHQNLNIVRFNSDALADAQRLADELLAEDPLNPWAISTKVHILLNQQKREEALALVRGAIFQDKNEPRLRSLLAHTLTANGQYEEATKAIDIFLAMSPRLTKENGARAARLLLRVGQPERALEVLDGVTDFTFDNLGEVMLFTEAYSRLGRKEDALQLVEKIKEIYPSISLEFIEPQFRTYKDRQVYDEYFNAMNSVGIPMYAFGLDNTWAENRMTEAELQQLFKNDLETVDTIDPVGGPYIHKNFADGRISFQWGFLPGMLFDGTWDVEGDLFCVRFEAIWMGHRVCYPFFHDVERSTPDNPRYVGLSGFGPHYFGVRSLEN